MKQRIQNNGLFFGCWIGIVCLLALGCSSGGGGGGKIADDELSMVQQWIQEAQVSWSAGNNSISVLPAEDRRRRSGTLIDASQTGFMPGTGLKTSSELPAVVDWRTQGVVTPVKNQGDCGADWAFAAVAALESQSIMVSGNTGLALSEQKVLSCAGSCSGGYASKAADYLRDHGTYSQACGPFVGADIACGDVCPAPESDPVKIKEWLIIPSTLEAIRQVIYEFGPVIAVMDVHTDFYYYHTGIYEHVWGEFEGCLSLLVVGWNDEEGYFIAKNSWGENWGEGGFVRLSYAELAQGRLGRLIMAYRLPVFHPPLADAGADQTVLPGEIVQLSGAGSTDADHDIVSYHWAQTSGTSVVLSDANIIDPIFTAPDTQDAQETLIFKLTVTDAQGLWSADSCYVMVEPKPNNPPIANAGLNQSVVELDRVTLDGSASSDPDNTILSYLWTQTYGTVVELSDPTAAVVEFIAPESEGVPAKLYFQLEVTDKFGLTDTDSVMIVLYPNQPPAARAGVDQFVQGGSRVMLDGSGSLDLERRITAYRWTQTSGTTVRLEEADTALAYFTAPITGTTGEVLSFQLEVIDHLGLVDRAKTNVVITDYPVDQNRGVCPSDCRLILNICSCPEACDFAEGWVIGIDLQILTPGVYWAEDPNVAAFTEALSNCYRGDKELHFSRYAGIGKACTGTNHTHTFKVSYYNDQRERLTGPGLHGANRAKIIRTPTPYDGYELTREDVVNRFCDLWVDMPAMTIVPSEINPGSQLIVRVSLLSSAPLTSSACYDADYLRPVTPAAPPECQMRTGLTGNGNCKWNWSSAFCPTCSRNCYCDKILGPICCP